MGDKPPFESFPKIPRLRRTVVVTEKIDGTNAQILILENGEVHAGSRNRYITPEQDNYGFAVWVKKNEETLRTLLGPGRHFGEWWGTGIQRGYDLREKRFSLFNTSRWKPSVEGSLLIHECGVYVVPTLAISEDHDVIAAELSKLRETGSRAALGYMKPEGVVVYHTAAGSLFKVLLENDHLAKGQAAE
jgi:RNA ligase